MKQNPLLISKVNNLVEYSDNIILNYHILNENELFVQAYNQFDFYFANKQSQVKGSVEFKLIKGIEYSVEEYELSGTKKLGDRQLQSQYELNPQELRLFLIKFR
jgi:hypothetical protein